MCHENLTWLWLTYYMAYAPISYPQYLVQLLSLIFTTIKREIKIIHCSIRIAIQDVRLYNSVDSKTLGAKCILSQGLAYRNTQKNMLTLQSILISTILKLIKKNTGIYIENFTKKT